MARTPSAVTSSRVVPVSVSVRYSGRKLGVMSLQTMFAPSRAKARAVARPMPELEPVIMAVLEVRRPGILGKAVDIKADAL